MRPIATPETNIVYTLGNCGDLPGIAAHDEDGTNYVVTAWKVSPEELQKIEETGIIWLSITGTQVPPVALTAENPMKEEGDQQ